MVAGEKSRPFNETENGTTPGRSTAGVTHAIVFVFLKIAGTIIFPNLHTMAGRFMKKAPTTSTVEPPIMGPIGSRNS